VNLIVVPIVLGIGVDDGVYVVAAAHERGGWGAALRHCGRALVVTSATTIAGFGFLAPSRFPALAGLGRLAAVGLSLCLLASITVVPALMTMLTRTDAQAKRWNR